MKAMILAAGKGTRVRPMTNVVPKPMIPLLGKPIMESIITHLRDCGVEQLVINTSHLAPAIEDYFRDGSRFGVEIAYSFEGRMVNGRIEGCALGSAGGIQRIQEFSGFFDETFAVICGDALIDLDLREVLAFHRAHKAIATIVLRSVPREEVFKYGVVATEADGKIVSFQEKPKVEEAVSNTINTGLYLFEPEVLKFVPGGVAFDIGGQLFPALVAAGMPLYGVDLPFHWVDIGSVGDYWEATRMALQGQIRGYRLPGRQILPGIFAGINIRMNTERVKLKGPIVIGSSSHIADGARVTGPAVIGAGSVVESGAVVDECILGDYTRVTSVAHLERVIVFGGSCIQPSGESLDIDKTRVGWVVDDARKPPALSEDQLELVALARSLR